MERLDLKVGDKVISTKEHHSGTVTIPIGYSGIVTEVADANSMLLYHVIIQYNIDFKKQHLSYTYYGEYISDNGVVIKKLIQETDQSNKISYIIDDTKYNEIDFATEIISGRVFRLCPDSKPFNTEYPVLLYKIVDNGVCELINGNWVDASITVYQIMGMLSLITLYNEVSNNWYDNIPPKGVFCWVQSGGYPELKQPVIVTEYHENEPCLKFTVRNHGQTFKYSHARPLTKVELLEYYIGDDYAVSQ